MYYSPYSPYLFVEIWVPKRAPYNGPHGWPSIVGDIVLPLMNAYGENILLWGLQEGPWFQLCFTYSDLAHAEKTLKTIVKQRGFRIKRYLRGSTLGGALGGTRWLPESKFGTRDELMRSYLLTQACATTFRLYVNTLVQKGRGKNRHWEVESPACTKQNPHGNLFESFMHLVANMSEAKFDLLIQAKTRWMHGGWEKASVVCHL